MASGAAAQWQGSRSGVSAVQESGLSENWIFNTIESNLRQAVFGRVRCGVTVSKER